MISRLKEVRGIIADFDRGFTHLDKKLDEIPESSAEIISTTIMVGGILKAMHRLEELEKDLAREASQEVVSEAVKRPFDE